MFRINFTINVEKVAKNRFLMYTITMKVFYGCLIIVLRFASTSKQAKSKSYPAKPNFDCHFLTKSPRGLRTIFLHRSRGCMYFLYVFMCMYVCMCVFNHCKGRNFYPIRSHRDP